jgi:hypothetical protein
MSSDQRAGWYISASTPDESVSQATQKPADALLAPAGGNATRRQTFMVVELETPAKMAELMYVLSWWLKTEPVFTPIMAPEIYAEAIVNAKKILSPQP